MSKVGERTKGEMEVQLADMQRKYRIMEGNRKNYSEDSQGIIRRQRATIDKVKLDNESLNREIALYKEGGTLSLANQKAMTDLQDEADVHLRKIEVERRRLEELDKQLHLAASKQEAQRRAAGGVNATKEIDQQVQRQIKVLESRLDKALIKFNEALAHNKSLREEIDHLRRERSTFETIYKKLEKELHEKKKLMVNVIEISNIAYEARDQAQNEIAALRAQADKEESAFELETKETAKAMDDEVRAADLAKEVSMVSVGGLSTEQEVLKKRVIGHNWTFGKERSMVDTIAEKVRMFDDAFAKIQAATGLTDINELVTSFINAEDQNFSLFNFANELNQETEKLEEQAAELKGELEKAKGSGASKEGQRKQVIEDLESELEMTCKKTESYVSKQGTAAERIRLLMEAIVSIFHAIGCVAPEDTEGAVALKESNMLMFLGIVEQRANEILQIQATANMYAVALPTTSSHGLRTVLGEGPSAPQGSSNVEILPPSTADDHHSEDESDEDIDDRPLSRDELQARTLRNLHKKEGRGAARLRRKK
mmetsp:Transcript_22591/g.31476  ORF Transcript_22591/g.31476 Transcript_22591/m.31476 type:complete len:541 (-) Transcript_22591:280-1902(-)